MIAPIELLAAEIGIRPYQPEDTQPLYAAVNESIDHIGQFMDWCLPLYSMADAESWVNSCIAAWPNGEYYTFVVFSRADQQFLGSVAINFINWEHRFANLGYWVRKSATGKNITSEAARLAARFAFQQLKLQRLEIVTSLENFASQRVAEKIQAKREGVLRKRLLVHAQAIDAVMYALLAEDL
jgi:RimJ/RimL family protein N-acetyltransferase